MNVHAYHRPGVQNPMSAWDKQDRDLIAERLRAGDSASQIAALFDGKTRNAIIGVVGRDPVLREIGFANPRGRRKGLVRRSPPPLPQPVLSLDEPHVAGRPIADLRANQCRYAVNDAGRGETHLFCGLPSDGHWCAFHRGLVYQPRSSLRDRRAA